MTAESSWGGYVSAHRSAKGALNEWKKEDMRRGKLSRFGASALAFLALVKLPTACGQGNGNAESMGAATTQSSAEQNTNAGDSQSSSALRTVSLSQALSDGAIWFLSSGVTKSSQIHEALVFSADSKAAWYFLDGGSVESLTMDEEITLSDFKGRSKDDIITMLNVQSAKFVEVCSEHTDVCDYSGPGSGTYQLEGTSDETGNKLRDEDIKFDFQASGQQGSTNFNLYPSDISYPLTPTVSEVYDHRYWHLDTPSGELEPAYANDDSGWLMLADGIENVTLDSVDTPGLEVD